MKLEQIIDGIARARLHSARACDSEAVAACDAAIKLFAAQRTEERARESLHANLQKQVNAAADEAARG
jgi:hypothetical protein